MERYSRQTLFAKIGPGGQEKLGRSAAAIVGCGALGSHSAEKLVRAGVGTVTLIDRDYLEWNNLQRQTLFDERDVEENLPKAVAAAAKLRAINRECDLHPVVADVNPANIEALLGNADIVVDGTDNFETRYLLNDACLKLERPWVYGACVGSYGVVMPILPEKGPCLRCLIPEMPPPGSSGTCDTIGVLNTIAGLIASIQANEAIKILIGDLNAVARGITAIDLWSNDFRTFGAKQDPHCPACAERRFVFLDASSAGTATTLCGRNAVQVSPASPAAIDLAAISRTLSPHGRIIQNEFLLRLTTDRFEMTLFPDGRAIFKGTESPSAARALYARYIGS